MTDDGRIIEATFPMKEAPPVGTITTIPDPDNDDQPIEATRLFSQVQGRGDNWKPYISNRLPRHLDGVPCTPSGKPIVASRKQEREIMAKFGYERE